MRALLIQSPFVQLNTPYPAPYYLKAFFESQSIPAEVRDHSIGLFERIFSVPGLRRIFSDAAEVLGSPQGKELREPTGSRPTSPGPGFHDPAFRREAERFLSQAPWWIRSIEPILEILRGKSVEYGHFLSLANGTFPSGPQTDALLAQALGEFGEPPEGSDRPSDRRIASVLLADLADFITVVLDPTFSLIKYADSLAASVRTFSTVEGALDGYILRTFYGPLCEEEWKTLEETTGTLNGGAGPTILAFTLPFPGTLVPALFAARSARSHGGVPLVTIAGSGYVNTELRSIRAKRFFDYFDFLSFDRGYGSLYAILRVLRKVDPPHRSPERADFFPLQDQGLYKTLYRSPRTGAIVGSCDGFPERNGTAENKGDSKAAGPDTASETAQKFGELEQRLSITLFPDYSSVDFSRYLLAVDDENPMHRLWTEGRWLKAYLAHGCYWHACAFCDVQLDYIRGFSAVDVDALFNHLVNQVKRTGVRGVHLVDEAAPAASLARLAELNREAALPLVFWGNIRIERDFTPDTAALLAAGGLIAVSAGIEVATAGGFKRLGKGIGLEQVVRACAAFKEAGILTHAYLIFGYYDQEDQEIIDSAETLRQLFEAGLLDSGFWHKFVLTRHSRIYAEWKRGRHPRLRVEDELWDDQNEDYFADNDLRFAGEPSFDRFSGPLDTLLSQWMAGDTAAPVESAFPFPVPQPQIAQDTVLQLLDRYARDRENERNRGIDRSGLETHSEKIEKGAQRYPTDNLVFLGSQPMVSRGSTSEKKTPLKDSTKGGETYLRWWWRLEECRIKLSTLREAQELGKLLTAASGRNGMPWGEFQRSLTEILGRSSNASAGGPGPLRATQVRSLSLGAQLRRKGLVVLRGKEKF
jgi:hypothetical protein